MSRFDYVKYDEQSVATQEVIKKAFTDIEFALSNIADGRAKSLALTKIEEAYMWCGKGIRDQQLMRNKDTELQEDRTNG